MKYFLRENEISTNKTTEIYDITETVGESVRESGIRNGHVLIQPLHTTVGIFLNENEPRLFEDLVIHLSEKAPQIRGRYLHDDIAERDCPPDEPLNGHSHIKAALYSNPSLSLVLYERKLVIGEYQRILFAEFDGPCPRKHKNKRKYLTSIIGE